MKQPNYSTSFYSNKRTDNLNSVEVIAPLLMEIFKPRSVVDVGCGTGILLATLKKLGAETILGLDGEWVDSSQLDILDVEFASINLEQPGALDARFDMAITLEVAEHISSEHAERFVEFVTSLSDIVVFSAAIPFQGGSNHINEQWPEYWRDIFEKHGYSVADFLRPRIWNVDGIETYYAQNIFAYARKSRICEMSPDLQDLFLANYSNLRRIHERLWESKMLESFDLSRFGTLELLKAIPRSIKTSLRNRFP